MPTSPKVKIIGVATFLVALALVLWTASRFWNLQDLKQQVEPMTTWVQGYPVISRTCLVIFFALLSFFSIPLASLTALLTGSVLGTLEGTLLLSLGGALGSSGTFLLSRWVIGPWVEKRWGSRVEDLRKRLGSQGPWVLLSLRLQPICPYFLINLFFGLTSLRFFTFWWIIFLALIPNVMVWVYAGTVLMELDRVEDAVSPSVTLAFVGVAFVPYLIGRMLVKKEEPAL